MEQARLLIAIVLSFLVFFIWNVFFVDQEALQPSRPPADATAPSSEPASTSDAASREPASQPAPREAEGTSADPPPAISPPTDRPPRTITVENAFYRVRLSERGGAVENIVLKDYREAVSEDAPLKALLDEGLQGGTVISGFTGAGVPVPRDARFATDAESEAWRVENGERRVAFTWRAPTGVVLEKVYVFRPDTYLIGLETRVINGTGETLRGSQTLSLFNRLPGATARFGFEGPSALVDNSLEQVQTKDIEDQDAYTGEIGWFALESRYFMTGAVPADSPAGRVHLAVSPDEELENRFIGPEETVAPGEAKTLQYDLFFGPKSVSLLRSYDNGLARAIDFGWFDFLAKPILWVMNQIYKVLPNYGVAIILLTFFIKILLWPLGNKSYKSMAEMKKLQPLMAEIREKYKDDKQKMNEELMGLYRIYKVNPVGGCLPMILQIPVFFAFYRMLYEAIELRHAPFVGWIHDLSAPDRLFRFDFAIPLMEPPYGIPVLTIVMGATMFLQQKMSPPPGDPSQAKIMMFMPLMFTVIFINFSSGLVLYWLVNNVLSIGQQYYVTKKAA
jgi:YidC/Oxa1 family membrane protein insertase